MNGLTELKGSVIKWTEETCFDILSAETELKLGLKRKSGKTQVKDGTSSLKPLGAFCFCS